MSKPSINLQTLIPRLARLTGTVQGLDASLMLVQYSTPAVIAAVLALATLRDRLTQFNAKGAVSGGASLRLFAEAWAKVGGSIGDARVIMRAFGLLPILMPAYKLLFPDPMKSLIFSPFPTIQLLSLLAYYPLEHISWLASKGVIRMSPQGIQKATLWSVRFWAIYVVLEIVKLRQRYFSLKSRTKALRNAKPAVSQKEAEGYELQDKAASGSAPQPSVDEGMIKRRNDLGNDWQAWKDSVLTNFGYAPLTIHWSAGGLWTNPLITSFFGTAAAIGQLQGQWRKASQ